MVMTGLARWCLSGCRVPAAKWASAQRCRNRRRPFLGRRGRASLAPCGCLSRACKHLSKAGAIAYSPTGWLAYQTNVESSPGVMLTAHPVLFLASMIWNVLVLAAPL
jgi:hypothetical protein